MGTSKTTHEPPPPAVYRDTPEDYAETASMSSAVLLSDIEASYPDEELPPYTDAPHAGASQSPTTTYESATEPLNTIPPELPSSRLYPTCHTRTTLFPLYSTDSPMLAQMTRDQVRYPPTYHILVSGSHTESRQTSSGKKEGANKIQDFLISIPLTALLGELGAGEVEVLFDGEKGYRGTRVKSLMPTTEAGSEYGVGRLEAWCQLFVADVAGVKSWSLKREVHNHDTQKVESRLRSAILETGYRGHLSISFPVQHAEVLVYSPGRINTWRCTTWIRWLFYLSFLWIFAWPVLWVLTKRYEVVKCIWRYANCPAGRGQDVVGGRQCQVMSEDEWVSRWAPTVRRAAVARMVCKNGVALNEAYRVETERIGQGIRPPAVASTGNGFADGAIAVLGGVMGAARELDAMRGWGADT